MANFDDKRVGLTLLEVREESLEVRHEVSHAHGDTTGTEEEDLKDNGGK